MPTPRITLNLLVCASLALAGVSLYAQSSTGASTPSSGTPQQTTPAPAPATPPPAAQQAPDTSAPATAQSTQDCQGPVLHRAPDKGGDICSTPTASPVPTSTDEDSTPAVTGKNGQTDP